jgi:hypothetical protein
MRVHQLVNGLDMGANDGPLPQEKLQERIEAFPDLFQGRDSQNAGVGTKRYRFVGLVEVESMPPNLVVNSRSGN